jgi:hypothetical protein
MQKIRRQHVAPLSILLAVVFLTVMGFQAGRPSSPFLLALKYFRNLIFHV